MLTQVQNNLLTQTGPDTPCGRLLRSYWQPIATTEEMPINGEPMPIRIMSEDLVLFRDDKERLGLIGRSCPHRGTDLSYGRVEDGGLRCLYHGWLFDLHGKCLDQPAEPEDKKFCTKVQHVAYPVQEKGGAIWTYMGKGEPPLIPDFQFLTAPEPNRLAFRVIQMCNWLQGLESSTDPVHTTFLHRRPPGTPSARSDSDVNALRGIEPPDVSTENTSYGTRIYALHNSPNDRKYLRVNNYVYPCGATPSTSTGEAGYQGRWYVPIDDFSHCRFEFFYRHSQPLDKEKLRKNRRENVAIDNRHIRRQENRYLQDREALKRGDSWGGMGLHFPSQDAFAIETQGAIQDRTKERLGSSDIVITAVRKTLFNAIKQIQDGGEAPGLIRDPANTQFADFICTSGYIEDHEDGPSFCRRILAGKAAANRTSASWNSALDIVNTRRSGLPAREEKVMDDKLVRESITGISHSGFYAEDLDRTAEFYTKVFGARVAWRNDKSKNPLMKVYIGDFGLSIIKRPPDMPKVEVPHAIHWAYRVDPARAEETVEYIKSLGIDVEGPVGHKREEGIVNWFFLDPDDYRVEIEARYPTGEEAAEVLERGKANRRSEMGLYGGDPVLKTSQ